MNLGFEEIDATGLSFKEGKVFEQEFENLAAISSEEAIELLRQGYLGVKIKNGKPGDLHQLPILILQSKKDFNFGWKTGSSPNFFLAEGDLLKYAIVNGYLIDLENPKEQVLKQRVF